MDLNDMMMQAQQMQLELARAQEEIKEMTRKCSRNYTATCGGLKVLKAEDMEAIYKLAR